MTHSPVTSIQTQRVHFGVSAPTHGGAVLFRDAFQFVSAYYLRVLQLWVHSLTCVNQGELTVFNSNLLTTISIFDSIP